ncbi:MAG TPA: protein kinase [Pirellulales bacterium]|nr:protein kinase [Pirellulales bacterium]
MTSPARPLDSLAATGSFDQINDLCRSFSEEGSDRGRLSIEDYLRQVADAAKPTLVRNLLHLDIERRRALGESPCADEYLHRLPDFTDLVRHVFLESSSLSTGTRSKAAAQVGTWDAPSPAPAPAANRLGEYELRRELGRGGMGTVYEAIHLRRGDRVALKTLPTVDGARLHRFKREFRSLADVNHPNLIGLGTLESDGGHWFFTMDLIDGTDFLSYVRPQGTLDEARLRAALGQLVAAVMALHGHHIIHRDLKPSNVMVDHDGRVLVLDFGLVMELDDMGGPTASGRVEGTPRYMAPEQAAGERVGSAADWYAVGVMLYETLAGKPPFQGPLLKMLQDKQQLDPAPISPVAGLPGDLAELAMRLLNRDPEQRPDARQIAKTISLRTTGAVSAARSPGSLLVGRTAQLQALAAAYETVIADRRPGTVFIGGRSGEGKTSLAEHFLERLRRRQAPPTILSGRCYDRESVPFKALDALIDALSGHLRSLDPVEAALLMPDDVSIFARVFPVLQRVEVLAQAPRARTAELDEQQMRTRAFAALRLLMLRLSDRAPMIMFVDDLQWGDAGSAEVLFEVLRPPDPPAIMLLAGFRSDEWDSSPFRLEWVERQKKLGVTIPHRDVTVSPLSPEECLELVVSMLGRDDEVIRRRAAEIHGETGGNPFLLTELVSCFDPDSDSFRPLPMHEAIAQKLTRLPRGAAHLLDIVAVSGQALSLDDVSKTAGYESPAISTITHMRTERLLRLIGAADEPLVDTYHDRIRESVLGQMRHDARRGLHLALAETIEKSVGALTDEPVAAPPGGPSGEAEARLTPRVYDLAYHFDAAGASRKAAHYALAAADQARRQFSLEVAAEQYTIAKRNTADDAAATRFRIAEGCGETLMLLGRYDDANEQLTGAIELVDDAESKARIEALQGEIAFKQGAIDKSTSFYEQGLRRLDNWVPSTRFGLVYGILRESAIQCGHSVFPARLHRRPPTGRRELVVRCLARATSSYVFQNTLKLMWAGLAGLNRAELLPPSTHLAFSYGVHACFMAMLGWQARAPWYGDRAMALSREFDDLLVRGQSCNYPGIGLYAAARYEEGLARLNEALAAFDKAGDLWELHIAHFHQGCCHYGLGNLAEAVAEARWTFASSTRIGDSRTLCSSWLWARAMRGNIPFEELRSCYPRRPDDIMSTVHGVLAEGYWHSFHGRSEEALGAYERASEMVWKSLCVNSHTILVLPMLAAGLRLHADVLQPKDAKRSERLRRRAYRLAKWAARISRLIPAAYPISLRELSLILAARGKTKQALRIADKSCAVAQRQKASYEYAQSLLVRGKLALALRLPGAQDQIAQAQAALRDIEGALLT